MRIKLRIAYANGNPVSNVDPSGGGIDHTDINKLVDMFESFYY